MCIADRPEGPYEMIPFGTELYDPGLFFDDDGRAYVAHGANGLWLTELTADARAIRTPGVFISQSAFGNPLEGSHLYKRGGHYYWCITSRGYNGIQIVMRSRNIRGPYESRVICADDMNYAGAGLHQGGFVETPAGETWFFMFQDRDWIGRAPVLLPVTWTHGWPTLGDAGNFGKVPVTCRKPAGLPASAPAVPEGSDHFDAPHLDLRWQWNHNPDEAKWSLTERPGFLRLHASPASDFWHARNTLSQKMVGPASTATALLDTAGLRDGDIAGLAVLGFPHALIGMAQEAGRRRVVMINDGKEVADAEISAERVHLRCTANSHGIASFSYSTDGRQFTPIGNELVMQFSVRTFLGNRWSLFSFNRGSTSATGYADFDSFELNPIRPANDLSALETIPAARYDSEFGTDTQRFAEKSPRQRVVDIDDGDWLCFNHIDFGSGTVKQFTARASAIGAGGSIEIRLESLDGPLAGVCRVNATGVDRWQAPFADHTCPVNCGAGVRKVFLRFVAAVPNERRGLFWLESFSFS